MPKTTPRPRTQRSAASARTAEKPVYPAVRDPAVPPAHPGEVLREVLSASDLSVVKAAALLGVSRQQLHAILRGASPVTAETALRLGALFGNGPDLWINMQTNRDLWFARKAMRKALKQIDRDGAQMRALAHAAE